MQDPYPAHIRKNIISETQIEYEVQSVSNHCKKTAQYAANALKEIGLENTAYLAGLLHDMGKYTDKFKNYIEAAVMNGEYVKRGSVNHTFSGVRYLLERHVKVDSESEFSISIGDLVCEIVAYAVGSHHGFFDCVSENKESGFQHRVDKENIDYEEAVRNFFLYCVDEKTIDEYFSKSCQEISLIVERINSMGDYTQSEDVNHEISFYISMLCRLLTSAVIHGDRKDTIEFNENIDTNNNILYSWDDLLAYFNNYISGFPQKYDIDRARKWISDECFKAALKSKGIYRLNVPTGGGKTLASLRYALAHAKENSIKRIFFVMPLLSIIEQNAQEIRKAIGNDSLILEHHSNVIDDGESYDELNERELLVNSWDSPVIITTLVQFLNTLFLGKTTSVRRFSTLVNSIIIFDEVQTVPIKMLTLYNLAINFLTEVCGATVILCSATQPCLEKTEHPLTSKVQNLINISEKFSECFNRTDVINSGSKTYEEIIDFTKEILQENDSLLIVCNTKSEAKQIFESLKNCLNKNVRLCHLSASMCVFHRKKVISDIKKSLSVHSDCKVVCIATQVIEAGVDVSFSCVIRLQAGMDNIVQAAGRCNRHGECEKLGKVYIIRLVGENLSRLPDIQRAKDSTSSLLEVAKSDNNFGNLLSEDAIKYYYKHLYRGLCYGFCDFPLRNEGVSIFNLLAPNIGDKEEMVLPFFLSSKIKTAGSKFCVFDNDNFDLLVPYKSGVDIINVLESEQAKYDKGFVAQQIKSAVGYTIGVFKYQLEALEELHAIRYIEDFGIYILLNSEFYKEDIGLDYTDSNSQMYSW